MAVDKILTPEFRVAFPSVFKKRAYGDSDAKFTITMLFPKKSTDLSTLKAAAEKALGEEWPKNRPKKLNDNPILDGDEVDWDGFAGNWYVRATSLYQPGIVDRKCQPITDEDNFYAGCWARGTVNAFTYNKKKGNSGVSFGLQNLQFIRDDDPFTGRTNAEDDFEDLPDVEGDGAMAPNDLGDLA